MNLLQGHALVICTYRRADRITILLRYLNSLDALPSHLVIVNGAGPGETPSFPDAAHLEKTGVAIKYLSCPPSTPMQRAEGLASLPETIGFVHFIDDDFFPAPDYFSNLAGFLEQHDFCAGAGGVFSQPVAQFSHPKWRKWFGLDGEIPGKILRSGYTTNGQANLEGQTEPFNVDWLSGCSMSYRISALKSLSFPAELEGYAMDEDLIISHQAAKSGVLTVVPEAKGRHDSQKEIRSDKPWFFYSLAARKHAVKFYLRPPASLTRFWVVTIVRLLWRLWRIKAKPAGWFSFWNNVRILVNNRNAPKMDTFSSN